MIFVFMIDEEKNISQSFSLPASILKWLDEKERKHESRSKIVQRALQREMQYEIIQHNSRIAFSLFSILVGGTIAIFTVLLMPYLSTMFIVFIVISMLSFFAGYLGLVMLYKEKLNDKANNKHIGK
jgi:general stress protein CsbA